MEFIIIVGAFFLIAIGLMYAVSSEGGNPTPTQIKNRIIMRRKWKKIKKALTPDEIIFPMILAIIILGAVGYLAVLMGGA